MLFDSRLGPYDLNSLQVFWDGFRWSPFSSLVVGAAGPATHCLVVLRRGAPEDGAQISVGLLRPHTVHQTSYWDGDMCGPGAGGRVESVANHVPETEGGTIS